jgi:D-alanine transaminase
VKQASIIYHRGEFTDYADAGFEVQDRGVLFADGVYEVVRFDRGRPFGMRAHVDRLAASLRGIELPGVDAGSFADLSHELMQRNGLTDAKVYWQVTRGPAPRDFVIDASAPPSVTLLAFPTTPIQLDAPLAEGTAVVAEDCRWTRCQIKSLMLLPASLAKTRAHAAGAAEAIFERAKPGSTDRHITEGSSTNVFIVEGGTLRTHPADGWVLNGVTRLALLDLAGERGLAETDERPFTRRQLLEAREVFVCSTTQLVAITAVDGQTIGDGRPGPVTQQLDAAYRRAILSGE